MKKTALIIITLLMSFGFIQTTTGQNTSQRAKNYLTEVNKRINALANVSIDFTHTITDKNKFNSMDAAGHIDIKKDLYLVTYDNITRLYDGKKTYTISSENEEVTIESNKGDKDGAYLPSQFLTFFNEGFNYTWDISATIKGKRIQYIKLTPIDKNSPIANILLGIDDQTKMIYTKVQTNKDGSKSTLTVNSLKTNSQLSKNHFTFTKSMYPSHYYINTVD